MLKQPFILPQDATDILIDNAPGGSTNTLPNRQAAMVRTHWVDPPIFGTMLSVLQTTLSAVVRN